MMTIGVLKEPPHENRVAWLAEVVSQCKWPGVSVVAETGAGSAAFSSDAAYQQAGARIANRAEVLAQSDWLLCIHPPAAEELAALKPTQVILCASGVLQTPEVARQFEGCKATVFSLDLAPRTTRAQAIDVLSSMATVAGYKAVLEAAAKAPFFFPMFMSAAGTIRPAQVLVLGAGVAGLQAIATSRKLGAVVAAFDVRTAVKEEVMSLGAKFVEVEGAVESAAAGGYAVEQSEEFRQKQMEAIHQQALRSSVVIATAQIPGRKAPTLITRRTVEAMPQGAVIIDLAAATGGNCELTQNNQTIVHQGVTIIGQSNFPSAMPADASRLLGRNYLNFLKLFFDKDGRFSLNWADELITGSCLMREGQLVHERIIRQLQTT